MSKRANLHSLSQAAKKIGVSPITLKRWLLLKKVNEVSRDRNGWRVFTDEDIRRIRSYAERLIPPKSGQ
jgi:DNA-binding transcriptional MerR regulator